MKPFHQNGLLSFSRKWTRTNIDAKLVRPHARNSALKRIFSLTLARVARGNIYISSCRAKYPVQIVMETRWTRGYNINTRVGHWKKYSFESSSLLNFFYNLRCFDEWRPGCGWTCVALQTVWEWLSCLNSGLNSYQSREDMTSWFVGRLVTL